METFSLDFSGNRASPISPFLWSEDNAELDIDFNLDPLSSSPEEQEESPVRSFICLKDKVKLKEYEEREDCFILDFDPDDSGIDISKLTIDADNPDICVIAQTGQVACIDYPHSRHDCRKHPFKKTPHESYCELCYCYVCDVTAPCYNWSGQTGHCHAVHEEKWTVERNLIGQSRKTNASFPTNV